VTKLFLTLEEAVMVNDPAACGVMLVRDKCMEHLVIDHVFKIPAWDELTIEQRMNADDAIFFLNAAKDDVARWPSTTAAPPRDLV
jgi:hypothetical protein